MSNESINRNYALRTIHDTDLPSYCVWDGDSIMDVSHKENLDWWIETNRLFTNTKIKDTTLTKIINKWTHHYKNLIEHPNEYCSKRQPYYLDCDI